MRKTESSVRRRLTETFPILGAALLYAFFARAILVTFPTMDFSGVFHPWIGISLAILLRDWRRYLPGVLLGSITVNVITTGSIAAGVPVALGAVLASTAGVWIITKCGRFDPAHMSLRNYLCVLSIGGGLSGLAIAFLRSLVLLSVGVIQSSSFFGYLLHWWMGDVLGVALITPLILVVRVRQIKWPSRSKFFETLLLQGLCFIAGQIIFLDWFKKSVGMMTTGYWMFLLITLVAVRLGTGGTAFALMMTAVQAFSGAYRNTGLFAGDVFSTGMIEYWLYLLILSMVGMALATYVSERTRAEERIRRLSMLYAALTHCNQAIVRCTSREELLPEVARIAVEYGGMKMAWFGWVDESRRCIIPVTSYGDGTSYLDDIQITLDENDVHSHGPCGTAVRERRPFWCQDIQNDPSMQPWRERGIQYNWRSNATVPLYMDGSPIGTFTVHSDHVNAFDDDAKSLLIRMGQDIGHALENYALEAERRRNEEILRGESLESLSQRDHALREITQGVTISDAKRLINYVNDGFSRITGYGKEEVLGRSCKLLQGSGTNPEALAVMRRTLENGQPFHGEILNYRKDGTSFWNELSITPVFNSDGQLTQWVGVQSDISERKHAESALQQNEALSRALLDSLPGIFYLYSYPELRLERWNKQHETLLGYSAEELKGKHITDWYEAEAKPLVIDAVDKVMTQGQNEIEAPLLAKDGRRIPFWLSGVRVDAQERQYFLGIGLDISERKQAEDRIRRLNNLYATLSHCNNSIVHCSSRQELFDRICEGAVRHGAMRMAWIGMVDDAAGLVYPVACYGNGTQYLKTLQISLHPQAQNELSKTAEALIFNKPVWCQDLLQNSSMAPWHKAAAEFGMHSMAALPLRKNGVVVGNFTLYADTVDAFDEDAQQLLIEMAQDVGFALENFEREEARQKAEAQLHLAANVFAQSNEAIIVADANRKIVLVNKAFTRMTGYSEEDVLGQDPSALYSGYKSEETLQTITDALERMKHWQGEVWNRRKDGESYLEWLSVSLVHDAEGKLTNYVATASDITQRRQDEERMHWLSHFDRLTGLPNRVLLEDRCKQAISMAQGSNEPLALMFLDLDHFKNINDTIGHRVGDMLLVELANRLTFIAREQDTVSRLGGDDFVLVLPGVDAGIAAHIAEEVMTAISHPYHIEGHELIISASIGIAMHPVDGDDFDALIQCADMAMYRSKEIGRNTFCFFTPEIQARSLRALQLENALRRALEREQLSLQYQPQVSLEDGRIVGAEALLRWNHPELGFVSPAEFIPIAESSGLIMPIGEWVMRTAAQQLRTWMDQGFSGLTMSVNLSAVQFRHANLSSLVMNVLDESDLPPQYFELELTESVAMENPQAGIAVMDELHRLGIRMSIDDFGTGYSSLAHLKRFKVYKLKIDRSFVNDIASDSEDKAIVGAVISLAQSLGLHTIAEGVETEEQLKFLRDNGCGEIQGYYFSRPLPADQFEALFRSKQTAQ